MAEDTVAQPPASIAKFNRLITEALTEGPKRVKEIYQIALERQPQDCPDVFCPHRKKTSKSYEWQHEIQRQLARIAANREGLWCLKAAQATAVPAQAEESAPAESEDDIAIPEPLSPAEPYKGDPFIMAQDEECPPWACGSPSPHFMDVGELKKPELKKRFVVPNNFDEFYAWKQDYVLTWVKKRLNRFQTDDEVEDWTQDLLIHLRYLPQSSKHRRPGANGRARGCQDVIETYDPLQQYGASERRFRNYVNNILGNKFLTVQSKRQKNPVLRPGNISFGSDPDDSKEHRGGNSDEFVHANSDYLVGQTTRLAKQHDDRLYTNQFKRFVAETDSSAYPALEALESTGTISEAARFMGVSDGEFTRFRNRLKQLGECFEKGTPVPKQRRPYKKRAKATAAGNSTPTV